MTEQDTKQTGRRVMKTQRRFEPRQDRSQLIRAKIRQIPANTTQITAKALQKHNIDPAKTIETWSNPCAARNRNTKKNRKKKPTKKPRSRHVQHHSMACLSGASSCGVRCRVLIT
eukprot:3378543-Rhodomonas_salina.3